jgi:hypothetical protein
MSGDVTIRSYVESYAVSVLETRFADRKNVKISVIFSSLCCLLYPKATTLFFLSYQVGLEYIFDVVVLHLIILLFCLFVLLG